MSSRLKPEIKELLFSGAAIPAHPLALNEDKTLDELSQRALSHYYIDAGVDGIAVGVHTTQFEIRDPQFNLYETILTMAMEEINKRDLDRPFIKIAGISGPKEQAVEEAKLAASLGYDLGLLAMGGLQDLTEEEILDRAKAVAKEIPLFGFYLQPSAGGRIFSYDFWHQFMEIEGVCAVKTAPFNRYQTLDVLRAVAHSSQRDDIAVYTGNDDNIVADLLTTYEFEVAGEVYRKQVVGGLLGHWAAWTKSSVDLFHRIKAAREANENYAELLTEGVKVTDMNAAFFDVKNNFKGSIAGINEMLSRSGLLKGNTCLMDHECLSPGQLEELNRIEKEYADYADYEFIKENIEKWRQIASEKK